MNPRKLRYDEDKLRQIVKSNYEPEQQQRMLFVLDHYWFDFDTETWKLK